MTQKHINKWQFRDLSRAIRIAWYHWRHGPRFSYHGVPIDLPARSYTPFKIQLIKGSYEEPERRLIDKYLDPSLPVLELGGSLGIISAYITGKLHKQTPFVIVEANSAVLDICKSNANWKRRESDVEVIHAAIAYDHETVAFRSSENVHISKVATSDSTSVEMVKATNLSDILEDKLRDRPYTLIMDIEGMELDVLAREPEAFEKCALAIIEFHPGAYAEHGNSVEKFFALAAATGLDLIEIDGHSAAFSRL